MLVKLCKICNKEFIPSSRHKNCPSCRNKLCRSRCAICKKRIQCGSTRCKTCNNKTRNYKKDLRQVAVSYILRNCRNRNKEVNLTSNYLINLLNSQNGRCAYTGLPLSLPTWKGCFDKRLCASLDRINSSLGYIEGNVQWVIYPINLMKNTFSDIETKELINWIKN